MWLPEVLKGKPGKAALVADRLQVLGNAANGQIKRQSCMMLLMFRNSCFLYK